MKTKISEGVRRLSIIMGAIPSIAWFIFIVYSIVENPKNVDLTIVLFALFVGCLFLYSLGWGIVRAINWIYKQNKDISI